MGWLEWVDKTMEAFEEDRTVARTLLFWESRTPIQLVAMNPFAPVTRTVELARTEGIVMCKRGATREFYLQ